MALSPEVQASIIKVAGDWAIRTTDLSLKLKPKPVQDTLLKYFTEYYNTIITIVGVKQ